MPTGGPSTTEPHRRPRALGRSGFTLVELLLALTLLVTIGAIASVGLTAGDERARLARAADQLDAVWSRARLRAIEAGTPLVFRCRLGERWGYVGAGETPMAPSAAVTQAIEQVEINLGADDHPVRFDRLTVSRRPGEPPVGGAVREGELSAVVAFSPDGATSDAEATLITDSGKRVVVTLRGLTGGVRISWPTADERAGAGQGAAR